MDNKKHQAVMTVITTPGEGHPGKPVERIPSQERRGAVSEGDRPPGNVAKTDRARDEKRPRIKRTAS